MILTRIEQENLQEFVSLCPDGLIGDDELLRLGIFEDDDGTVPISVLVACVQENMACIRWLYTVPDHRNQGAARGLVLVLQKYSRELGLDGILVNFSEENEHMEDLLMELGFLTASDPGFYRVPIFELVYSSEMEKLGRYRDTENTLVGFSDPAAKAIFRDIVKKQSLDMAVFEGISSKYSVTYRDPDGRKTGGIFITDRGEGDLYVDYMYSQGSVKVVSTLISTLSVQLIEGDRTEDNLIFSQRDGRAGSIIEALTGNDCEVYQVPGLKQAILLYEE